MIDPKRSDPNQLAKSIIDSVTGQQPSPVDTRDPAAVALKALDHGKPPPEAAPRRKRAKAFL